MGEKNTNKLEKLFVNEHERILDRFEESKIDVYEYYDKTEELAKSYAKNVPLEDSFDQREGYNRRFCVELLRKVHPLGLDVYERKVREKKLREGLSYEEAAKKAEELKELMNIFWAKWRAAIWTLWPSF